MSNRPTTSSTDLLKQQFQKLCQADYEILTPLGQGSFGLVYLGHTKHGPQKKVALKCINKGLLVDSQQNEQLKMIKDNLLLLQVDIMMNCQNKHIIKCLDLIQNDHLRIIVLEYCNQGDLSQRIEREKKIPENEAIYILAQLVYGFATLHQKKIIHRDLKSENIFIKNGVYKIADFGAAKKIASLTFVNKGIQIGSKSTMAPEISNGEEYGIQCDMWSLGVIFFEMLFGVLPFGERIEERDVEKVRRFLERAECSKESKELVRRALVVNQRERLRWVELYRMYNGRMGVFRDGLLDMKCIKIVESEEEEEENCFGSNNYGCFDYSQEMNRNRQSNVWQQQYQDGCYEYQQSIDDDYNGNNKFQNKGNGKRKGKGKDKKKNKNKTNVNTNNYPSNQNSNDSHHNSRQNFYQPNNSHHVPFISSKSPESNKKAHSKQYDFHNLYVEKSAYIRFVRLKSQLIHIMIDNLKIVQQKQLQQKPEILINRSAYFVHINYYARYIIFMDPKVRKYVNITSKQLENEADQDLRREIYHLQIHIQRLKQQCKRLIRQYENQYNKKLSENKSRKNRINQPYLDQNLSQIGFRYRYVTRNDPSTNAEAIKRKYTKMRNSLENLQLDWNEEEMSEYNKHVRNLIENLKGKEFDQIQYVQTYSEKLQLDRRLEQYWRNQQK